MTLPTLYKKTSSGKIQMWRIWVSPGPRGREMHESHIHTEYGLQDGKKQSTLDIITLGKNIGKSNETTPMQQAVLEAKAQHEGKLKKGYVTSIDDAESGKVDDIIEGGILPMLAHKFSEQGHKIKYPAYVQPKLDGHRCIAMLKDGKCTLWSRTRKRITGVPHIERALEKLYPENSTILDGELYNHNYRDKFEELTSFIRQETPKDGHEIVQYWIYDVIEDGWSFSERIDQLEEIEFGICEFKLNDILITVETFEVNEDDLMGFFDTYLKEGFEGLMVRNADGLYEHKRSYNLQKVKEFLDSEYEIKDVVEGRGKMTGLGIFVCLTLDGQEFNAKMRGSLDDLGEYFVNKDKYIGQMLTVKYQGLTKNGIPRFPIGERIRQEV